MKVLLTADAFYPDNHGGPSYSIYWLAKSLSKNDQEVTVLTTTKGLESKFPANQYITLDNFKVKYCSFKWPKMPFKYIFNGIKAIPNTDVLHLSSVCFVPSFIFAIWGRIFRKKIFWSPRGELAIEAQDGSILKKYYFKAIQLCFKKYVNFHVTSEKELQELNTVINPDNSFVLPNYMELPSEEPRESNEKYLLYVGRINKIKALHKLVRALSLSESFINSDYKLKIAGDTTTFKNYYDELVELIGSLNLASKVEFLGRIDGQEKLRLYTNAYFFFLVSESENFGNVVIESMSQGTPAVTSLGTPWCELETRKLGYHVSNNPDILSKVIDKILTMPNSDYEKLRKDVRKYCNEEFSIDSNVYKWIQIYNS